MQQFRQILIPMLILAGSSGGYYWLSTWNTSPRRVIPPLQSPLVETGQATAYSGTLPIRIHGVVVPYREIRITAEVAGRIVNKHEELRSGRFVPAQTALLTIDPAPYRLELEKLDHEARQIEFEQRRSKLQLEHNVRRNKLVERRLELALQELKRLDSLQDRNALTKAVRDRAEQISLEIQNDLALLQGQGELLPLQQAEIQSRRDLIAVRKKQAEYDLSRTEITAPLDAVITADVQEAGGFVLPGDHLLTLQDLSHFEVSCRLRSDDLLWLLDAGKSTDQELSLKAALELPRVPARVIYRTSDSTLTWEGRLSRTDGTGFDAQTRTLACRVVVDRPQRPNELWPAGLINGMFVDIEIDVKPVTALLSIPRQALQPNGQVWVVHEERLTVHRVDPVRVTETILLLRADRTELKPSDRVVVSTLSTAFDGMDVRERPAP